MVVEQARKVAHGAHPKAWGVSDLRPWSDEGGEDRLIGELSYERMEGAAPDTALLLKLLFTSAPLSIQVHPDDAQARSLGLPNGKSEAWYVLHAAPDAKVALGLDRAMTREQLRHAVDDGSLPTRVKWLPVHARDVIDVPAGTIHAIGAGVMIAEIQQRSGTTFRLFDFGRDRGLHVDAAISTSDLGPPRSQSQPERLSAERTLLTSNSHFAFEHLELPPGSNWHLDAARETWLLGLDGTASSGRFDLAPGNALFAEAERVEISVGRAGATCLVAYAGGLRADQQLLRRLDQNHGHGVLELGDVSARLLQIGLTS